MSFAALNWAVEVPLKNPEKPILIALANYADEANSCNPSIKRIAFIAGICERTARMALARLVRDGWIAVVHLAGKRSRYVLAMGTKGTAAVPSNGTHEGGLGAVLVVDQPRSNPETKPPDPGTTCTPAPRAPLHQMPHTPAPHAAHPGTTCRTVHKNTKDYEGRKNGIEVRGCLANETIADKPAAPGDARTGNRRLPSAVRQAVVRDAAADWAASQQRRPGAQLTAEQLRSVRKQAAKQRLDLGLPPITYGND